MYLKIWMNKFNPTLHAQFQQVVAWPHPNHAKTWAWVRRDCHLTHQTQMQLPYLWSSADTQADPVLNKKVSRQNGLNTKGHWSQTWCEKKNQYHRPKTKDQRLQKQSFPHNVLIYGLRCCGLICFSDLLMFCWCRSLVLGPWFSFQEWAACYTYDDSTGNEEGPNKKEHEEAKDESFEENSGEDWHKDWEKTKGFCIWQGQLQKTNWWNWLSKAKASSPSASQIGSWERQIPNMQWSCQWYKAFGSEESLGHLDVTKKHQNLCRKCKGHC